MKTSNKAHDAATYGFSASERILVDANVWLYLCPPAGTPTTSFANQYSAVFRRVLRI